MMPCATRMLHDSVDHEDGSNGAKWHSCGGFIDASRRRCRAMAVDGCDGAPSHGDVYYSRSLHLSPWGAAPNTYAPTLPLKVERNGRYGM